MSVDDFFLVLEKSSLLAAEQIQAARQQAAGESDPKVVARKLLSDGLLTKWQARQLLHGRYALTMGPYKLLDQSVGDGVARTFLVQHGKSGQKAELRSLSRSHAAESPEAIEQFVAAAEQVSAAENRKLFEVHRPETSDDTCYVVLEEALGGVLPGTATDLSNSAVADTSTTAEVAQTAQPNREKKADPVVEQPGAQEAANARPPKLKAKARSVTATAATSASDAPASQDKPVSQDKPAGPPPPPSPQILPSRSSCRDKRLPTLPPQPHENSRSPLANAARSQVPRRPGGRRSRKEPKEQKEQKPLATSRQHPSRPWVAYARPRYGSVAWWQAVCCWWAESCWLGSCFLAAEARRLPTVRRGRPSRRRRKARPTMQRQEKRRHLRIASRPTP